jgi:hypothetical protein
MVTKDQVIIKRIQIRRDTLANWLSVNPVLADGEIAYIKNTNSVKIGDGIKKFSELDDLNQEESQIILDHINNFNNPHSVTAEQVGLDNVDNTSDADKPISSATLNALNNKVDKVTGKQLSTEDFTTTEKTKLSNIANNANNYTHPNHTGDVTSVGDGTTTITENSVTNTKLADIPTNTIKGRVSSATGDPEDLSVSQVKTLLSINNVDNTSDANKPISSATQDALDNKVDKVAGKQLSTEDYTSSEKTKLSGIEAGAQVNTVNSVNSQTGTVVIDTVENVIKYVRNTSGATLPIGTPVKVTGATGENPNVVVANALSNGIPDRFNGDKNVIFGITTQAINNNAVGPILLKGTLKNYNTNAFNVGDFLFVAASGTTLVNTPPAKPAYQICVGLVTKKATDGEFCANVAEPIHLNDITGIDLTRATLADKQSIVFNGTQFVNRLLTRNDVGLDSAITNETDTFTGSPKVEHVVTLTQAEYNGITPAANTMYVITDAPEIPVEVQTALDLKENAFTKNTAFNKNFGTTAGTVLEGNHHGSTGNTHGEATTSVSGFMSSTDKTKLNGIESGAQVNTVTSVSGKTGVVTLTSSDVSLGNVTNHAQIKKLSTSTTGNVPTWTNTNGDELSNGYGIEETLTGGSNKLVTAAAIKSYVDANAGAADAMIFKGTLGTGGVYTALPTTYSVGWTFKIITAGTYAGQVAEIGDMIIAIVARTGSGNLNSDWNIIQTNIDGAVTGPSSSVDNQVALFDGSSGKAIKSAGTTLNNGTLTLATSGIATGSQSFSANQGSNATFTVNVPATNIAEGTRTSTSVPITSSTGSNATLSVATTSLAGVMSSSDKTKLDGIATGATANTGTVTSVGGTGTVSGLTLTGTVTDSGNLTLGGTISLPLSQTTGTLPVNRGGTGETSYTNGQLLIGNTTGNTLTKATLTGGTGITVTNGNGSITVTNNSPNATHTGDVTGATALTIANSVVTNAKLANVAVNTIKGRITTGTGAVEDLTAANVRTIINVEDGAQVNVGTNIAEGTRTTTTVPITSSTGSNATLNSATTSLAGVMSSADKTKLDGIAAGAQVNVATNLTYSTATTTGTVNSSTGTNATIPAATTSLAGLMTNADKTKLDGIAAGAQVNVATNLGVTGTGNTRTITSSTGTNVTIPVATTTLAGWMSLEDKTKLDGVAASANNYSHPTGFSNQPATALTGANVISQITVNSEGHVTGTSSRGLTAANIGAAASSHTHGNITNAGAIGATANLPIITTTSGVLTTSTFGTAANTFCQGNDSRLSNARQATNTNTQLASLGVGTTASGTAGEIRATNNITAYFSDDRLKTRHKNISNALDKVKSLSGFYFTENEVAKSLGYTNDKIQVGVSAQEVKAILPEIVIDAPINANIEGADYQTVQYDKLVPLLIEAMKEQQLQIEKQQKEINELKSKLS